MKSSAGVTLIWICLIIAGLTGCVTADLSRYDKSVSIHMHIDNGQISVRSAELFYGSAPHLFPEQGGFSGELVAADGSVVQTFTIPDPRIQFGDTIVGNPGNQQILYVAERQNSADFVVTVPFNPRVTEIRIHDPAEGALPYSVNLQPPIDSFFMAYPDDPDNPALSRSQVPVMADTSRTGIPGPDTSSPGQLHGILAIGSGAALILGGGFASIRFLRKRQKSVLIVDDNPDIIVVIAGMLKQGGYATRIATSGENCLKELESAVPDLILLDIGMTPMDGWETLRLIKKNPVTKSIPVIMLTAQKLTLKDVEAYGICIDDYIMKPVTSRGLQDAIMHVFTRQQIIREKIAAARGAGIDRNELCECARLIRVVDVNKRLWDNLVRTYNLEERIQDPKTELPLALKNTQKWIRDQERRLEQIERDIGSGTGLQKTV